MNDRLNLGQDPVSLTVRVTPGYGVDFGFHRTDGKTWVEDDIETVVLRFDNGVEWEAVIDEERIYWSMPVSETDKLVNKQDVDLVYYRTGSDIPMPWANGTVVKRG